MRDIFPTLDPRARLLTIVLVIAVIASTPRGHLDPFPAFAALVLALLLTGRASWIYLIWRCLAASPFVLAAAALLAYQSGLRPDGFPAGLHAALSVGFKGYSASLLLAFLTATTPLSELLWALQRLKAPASLNLILATMLRYAGLLSEEYSRMERARACRTVRPLGRMRFATSGHQFGALILRSWDRAERVHAAMLSRGFTGAWPSADRVWRRRDSLFLAFAATAFLLVRLAL